MKIVRATLKILFHVLHALSVALLLGALLAAHIPPYRFPLLAFLGLLFPFLLLLNIFFLFFWIILRRWWALLPAATLCLAVPSLLHFCAFHSGNAARPARHSFRMMSYNVRNFDLYNWNHNKETRSAMFRLIRDQQPDIASFQEFYTSENEPFRNIEALLQVSGLPYYYFRKSFNQFDRNFWGIITFSRYPIIDSGTVEFDNRTQNGCLWVDLALGPGRVVRVFNVHLQSIHLDEREYDFMDSVADKKSVIVQESRNIFSKMNRAYQYRAHQAEKIAKAMAASPHPVLLSGDFNDTPLSYAYHTISHGMEDAFLEHGSGIGSTYIFFLPFFRIDYILHSASLRAKTFQILKEQYSDHYAIVSDLDMN